MTSFDFTPRVNGVPVDSAVQGGQVLGGMLWAAKPPHTGQSPLVTLQPPTRRTDTEEVTFTFDAQGQTGTVWVSVLWSQSSATPPTLEDLAEPILLVAGAVQRSALAGATDDAPCVPWLTPADLQAAHPALANLTATQLQPSCDLASSTLFMLSGRRFPGPCTATVRPVADGHGFCGYGGYGQYLDSLANYDTWDDGTFPWCQDVTSTISLGAPVLEVLQVVQDGAVVDPDSYRLDDYGTLRRVVDPVTGQVGAWPSCQRLDLDSSQPGTLEVTYAYGAIVPAGGKAAAVTLAAAFAFQDFPKDTTQAAPSRTTGVNRRGVSYTLYDPLQMVAKGFTGIHRVDLWVRAVNPQGVSRAARVYNPDMQRPVRAGT